VVWQAITRNIIDESPTSKSRQNSTSVSTT